MKLIRTTLPAIAGIALAQHAGAAILTYSALLSGPAEAPPNASPGIGSVTVIVDDSLNTMEIQASFSGLTGNTTVAHIHGATATPFTSTAGVAVAPGTLPGFPVGVTSGSYNNTLNMTLTGSYTSAFLTANGGTPATAFPALIGYLNTGRTYFNLHTSTFGGGEIRGFLAPVPEPGSSAALIFGAAMLIARRRR